MSDWVFDGSVAYKWRGVDWHPEGQDLVYSAFREWGGPEGWLGFRLEIWENGELVERRTTTQAAELEHWMLSLAPADQWQECWAIWVDEDRDGNLMLADPQPGT